MSKGKVVYIGGFGNSPEQAEDVASYVEFGYGSVGSYADAFTFSRALANPDDVRRAVKGKDVVTHSAGIMALTGTAPKAVLAIAPPVPTTRRDLVDGTVLKTVDMVLDERESAMYYLAQATKELVRHPGQIREIGRIANFNSYEFGNELQADGAAVDLVHMGQDRLFSETAVFRASLDRPRVPHSTINGVHDALVLDALPVLMNARNALRM